MKGPAHDTQKWTESRHTYILEVSEDQILKKSVKEIKSYRQNIFLFKQLSFNILRLQQIPLIPQKEVKKIILLSTSSCVQTILYALLKMLFRQMLSNKIVCRSLVLPPLIIPQGMFSWIETILPYQILSHSKVNWQWINDFCQHAYRGV